MWLLINRVKNGNKIMQTEQTYADLAVLANKENKVIYKHENSDCELVDQITFRRIIMLMANGLKMPPRKQLINKKS